MADEGGRFSGTTDGADGHGWGFCGDEGFWENV
jgi:hypothetical protein